MAETSARQVALVTGGARGVGPAIALECVPDHDVEITCLSSQPDCGESRVQSIRADVRNAESHAAVVVAAVHVPAKGPVAEITGEALTVPGGYRL